MKVKFEIPRNKKQASQINLNSSRVEQDLIFKDTKKMILFQINTM
jgi:hypothetical protein